MELLELTKDELLEIDGGSELSDAFWSAVGYFIKHTQNARMIDEYYYH